MIYLYLCNVFYTYGDLVCPLDFDLNSMAKILYVLWKRACYYFVIIYIPLQNNKEEQTKLYICSHSEHFLNSTIS